MPHIDVSSDGEHGETDYSDFEYETFSIEGQADGGGASLGDAEVNVDFKAEWNPLDEIGGLDTNEVAEIAYLDFTVGTEWEDEFADQTQNTAGEVRGIFGANLNRNDLHFHGPNEADTEVIAETNGGGGDVGSSVNNRDEIFLQYRAGATAPFDEAANGAGGGGMVETVKYERNWRQMTGRGPVLDSTDNLTTIFRVIAGNTVIPLGAQLRGHLVYDVAEVSDAGRRFSVPMDD